MEEIGSCSPLPKIVGVTQTTTAKLAEMEVECLFDTGSMVTPVSETFYNQKLKSVCGGVQGGCTGGNSDSPKVRSAGPQRHSSHCLAEEAKTRSPGDECTCKDPGVGGAAVAKGERKYLVKGKP